MAKKDKRYHEPEEETVDPYTGEIKPVPEDADETVEIVPVDPGDRKGKDYLLEEENSLEALVADEDEDDPAQLAASYTDDEGVKEDFLERQHLAAGGREVLEKDLEEHHAESPELSGGDLDADWESANETGEETVGGTVPTPDQDVVDELGEAAGLTYNDEEPLHSEDKILKRDRNRWELDPRSQQDEESSDEEDSEEP